MARDELVNSVITVLQRAGWEHSYLPNNCFDLLSRGDDQSLLLKMHENVDSTTRPDATELKQAAQYLSTTPLIVGERNSRGELEQQVVYERYGIPTLKPETLESYLALQEPAYVMNKKGGYYVSLDADRIKDERKEQGYSLNALAKEVGVSRKTIQNYEEDGMATVEKAKRLEQVLGDVIAGIDLFEVRIAVERTGATVDPVAQRLNDLGMEASPFDRAPFDVAARDESDSFVAKQEQPDADAHLVELLQAMQQLAESTPFMVTGNSRQSNTYDEISTITDKELRRVRSKEAFKAAVQ